MDDYPTAGQPISGITQKDMLVSLRGFVHRDIMAMVTQIRADVDAVEERVNHVENKMGTPNVHNKSDDEIKVLNMKTADLVDHSRRNNVKFRGVGMTVCPKANIHITARCTGL